MSKISENMNSAFGKKVVSQSTTQFKIIGAFIMIMSIVFFAASTSIFHSFSSIPIDETEFGRDFARTSTFIQLFQAILAFAGFTFGLFLFASKKEIIYDEQTIEHRTTFLGHKSSKIIDRNLLRDIGPSALGLNPFNHIRDHRHF